MNWRRNQPCFPHLSEVDDVLRSVREERRLTLNPGQMEAIGAAWVRGLSHRMHSADSTPPPALMTAHQDDGNNIYATIGLMAAKNDDFK